MPKAPTHNTNYRGLYVQKDSNGNIQGVQISDLEGNIDHSITKAQYIEKQILPDFSQLPDKNSYKKNKNT